MKVVAICSCPRLGFMDFMGHTMSAISDNGVEYHNAFGCFWDQSLSEAMRIAAEKGFDYILTCDFDTIVVSSEQVAAMLDLARLNPEADAIIPVQMGRFSGVLVGTERGVITHDELRQDLVPVEQGHFGFTLIKVEALKRTKKPWFLPKPDSDGDWKRGSDKTDSDISFWRTFVASGNKAFLAPRIVLGHLELLIKWPDNNLKPMYQELSHFREDGPPGDVWT